MIYYYAFAYMVTGAILLITGLGLGFSMFAKSMDRSNKRYLIGLFSLQLVGVSLFLIDAFIYENPDFLALDKAINFLVFFSMAVLLAMPTHFLNRFAEENPFFVFFRLKERLPVL